MDVFWHKVCIKFIYILKIIFQSIEPFSSQKPLSSVNRINSISFFCFLFRGLILFPILLFLWYTLIQGSLGNRHFKWLFERIISRFQPSIDFNPWQINGYIRFTHKKVSYPYIKSTRIFSTELKLSILCACTYRANVYRPDFRTTLQHAIQTLYSSKLAIFLDLQRKPDKMINFMVQTVLSKLNKFQFIGN